MKEKTIQLNCALIKRQYVRKDGTNGYSMELYVPALNGSYRILTYKDDQKAYYLLDSQCLYIGNKTVGQYLNGDDEKAVKEGK